MQCKIRCRITEFAIFGGQSKLHVARAEKCRRDEKRLLANN